MHEADRSTRFAGVVAVLVLSLFVLLALPLAANALLKEPDGFRGMKWGAAAGELSKPKLLAEEGDFKFYVQGDEKLQVGDAHLDKIVYGFYKDKFFNVMVYFNSLPNFLKLKETCLQEFGDPQQPNQFVENYFWDGLDTTISLTYDEISKEGRIAYFSKPIEKEIEADEKVAAKKAVKDLE